MSQCGLGQLLTRLGGVGRCSYAGCDFCTCWLGPDRELRLCPAHRGPPKDYTRDCNASSCLSDKFTALLVPRRSGTTSRLHRRTLRTGSEIARSTLECEVHDKMDSG